jgi:hypothetical protein
MTDTTVESLDLAGIDAAIAGAKDRFDHADAPHNPDVLALIRAAETLRAAIEPAVYAYGPEGCINGERACEEYVTDDGEDSGVERCSHMQLRVAHHEDHIRLEYIRDQLNDIDPETETDEEVRHQLEMVHRYATAIDFQYC